MTSVTYAAIFFSNLIKLNGSGHLFRHLNIDLRTHWNIRNIVTSLNSKCNCVTPNVPLTGLRFQKSIHVDNKVTRMSSRPLHGSTQNDHDNNFPNLDYISFTNCDEKTRKILVNDIQLWPKFISEEEEKLLVLEVEPHLKRLRYESSHWDDAIHQYRETERRIWSEKNTKIMQRIRDVAFPPGVKQILYVHVLDLKKEGYIKPHVDAVKFCGNTVSGISLLSSSIMRFVSTEDKTQFFDVLLERRSLYIMKDTARYQYTHEVLKDEESMFKGKHIPRDRRIAVICRNEP